MTLLNCRDRDTFSRAAPQPLAERHTLTDCRSNSATSMKSHVAAKVVSTFIERLTIAGILSDDVMDVLRQSAEKGNLGSSETITAVRAKLVEDK